MGRRSSRRRMAVSTMVLVACAQTLSAQNGASGPCDGPRHRQFDFWIGSWVIEQTIFDGGGTDETFAAETEVRRALDGCAIVEEWRGRVRFPWEGMAAPDSLYGLSVRSFDETVGRWSIHWMDSRRPQFSGPFIGEFREGTGIFTRRRDLPDGSHLLTRIVFDEIEQNSVRWRLSVSNDDGRNWRVLWEMRMQRRDSAKRSSAVDSARS